MTRPGTAPTRTGRIALTSGSLAQRALGVAVQRPLIEAARNAAASWRSGAASPTVLVDVRRGGVLPAAQVEQVRVVADAGDRVRAEQLHPGRDAAGVPLQRGLPGALRGPRGARQLRELDRGHVGLALARRRRERADHGRDAVGVGVPLLLARRDLAGALTVVAGPPVAPLTAVDEQGELVAGQQPVVGEGRLGGGGPGLGRVGVGTQRVALPLQGRAAHHAARGEHRGDRHEGADQGVGTSASGTGSPQDRGPRPPRVLDPGAHRLEQRRHLLGADVPRAGEPLRGERQLPLGLADRDAQLAGGLGDGQQRQVVEQERLALAQRELAERVERRPLVGLEALVAVPEAGGVTALRLRPRTRPDPGLRVGHPAHLAPVVPGDDERVAHGGPGGRQVAGEGVRLEQQPGPGVLVERVELVRMDHGRSTVRAGAVPMHTGVGAPNGPGAARR
jgi:hypothetical protein